MEWQSILNRFCKVQNHIDDQRCGWMKFETLKRRGDFLHVRGGVRWVTPCFALQARHSRMLIGENKSEGQHSARIGFTVTKRIGNAVVRNRIKRRFREMVGKNTGALEQCCIDYVVIARPGAQMRRFEDLDRDFKFALKQVQDKLGKLQLNREKQLSLPDPSS